MKAPLLAAVVAALTLPAMASDLPAPAPPPMASAYAAPQAYDWTGMYLGGHFGWAWGDSSTTLTNSVTGDYIHSSNGSSTSFEGGGQIGYDFMTSSRVVFGLQTGVSLYPATSATLSNAAGTFSATHDASDRASGNVNARLGYAFGDLMPYTTGGWAWAYGLQSRTQNAGVVGLATPGTVDQADVYRNGFDLGAGLEYRLWRNWSVYSEYLYTKYSPTQFTFSQAERTNAVSSSANSLTFGVNYKF